MLGDISNSHFSFQIVYYLDNISLYSKGIDSAGE